MQTKFWIINALKCAFSIYVIYSKLLLLILLRILMTTMTFLSWYWILVFLRYRIWIVLASFDLVHEFVSLWLSYHDHNTCISFVYNWDNILTHFAFVSSLSVVLSTIAIISLYVGLSLVCESLTDMNCGDSSLKTVTTVSSMSGLSALYFHFIYCLHCPNHPWYII